MDDSITEENEQFYLIIDSASLSGDMVFGNLGAAVITILNDDSKLSITYVVRIAVQFLCMQ